MIGVYIAIAAVVVVVVAIFAIFSTNYIKAEPDRALILTGRKHSYKRQDGSVAERGWRVVVGGATLRIPILETVSWMSLRNMNLPDIKVQKAYNSEGVPVSIEVVANTKVSSESEMLGRAIERFLGKPVEEIKKVIKETIEGQLRDIIGTMTVEQLNQDRETFVASVLKQSGEELGKMGITVDVINIQSISDEYGYLEALGQKRTAEVKRDAEIGTANAERDAMKQAETARQEGLTVKAQQEALVAEANKERDVAMQQYHGETIKATETANQQGPLAMQQAEKAVLVAQQQKLEAEERARMDVEAAKADANTQLYRATTVVPADADKQAAILKAEGEAAAIKALADAGAHQERVKGEAEGAAIKAKLLGEAEGTKELAESLNKYEEAGKLKITLDYAKVVAEVGAKTLDNVIPDKVIVFDGNGNGSGSGLARALTAGPEAMVQWSDKIKAMTGIDITRMFEQYRAIEGTTSSRSGGTVLEE